MDKIKIGFRENKFGIMQDLNRTKYLYFLHGGLYY